MKVASIAPKKIVNYGAAVAALPLSLALPGQAAAATSAKAVAVAVRSTASSGPAMWLDREWAGLAAGVERVSARALAASASLDLWYETPDDVVYPSLGDAELLNVSLVEDSNADGFIFTSTDYEQWS